MKTALCFNPVTGKISKAQHIAVDEGFAGEDNPPPNAHLLKSNGVLSSDLKEELDIPSALIDMDISNSPFTETVTVELPLDAGTRILKD